MKMGFDQKKDCLDSLVHIHYKVFNVCQLDFFFFLDLEGAETRGPSFALFICFGYEGVALPSREG